MQSTRLSTNFNPQWNGGTMFHALLYIHGNLKWIYEFSKIGRYPLFIELLVTLDVYMISMELSKLLTLCPANTHQTTFC